MALDAGQARISVGPKLPPCKKKFALKNWKMFIWVYPECICICISVYLYICISVSVYIWVFPSLKDIQVPKWFGHYVDFLLCRNCFQYVKLHIGSNQPTPTVPPAYNAQNKFLRETISKSERIFPKNNNSLITSVLPEKNRPGFVLAFFGRFQKHIFGSFPLCFHPVLDFHRKIGFYSPKIKKQEKCADYGNNK